MNIPLLMFNFGLAYHYGKMSGEIRREAQPIADKITREVQSAFNSDYLKTEAHSSPYNLYNSKFNVSGSSSYTSKDQFGDDVSRFACKQVMANFKALNASKKMGTDFKISNMECLAKYDIFSDAVDLSVSYKSS